MAAILVLAGSVLGFFGGILAYTLFDASLLSALAIWGLSGPLCAALLVRPLSPCPEPASFGAKDRTVAEIA